MADIAGIPYFELELNRDAALVHPEQQTGVIDALKADPAATDLLVMSHGWNNDMAEARELYQEFFKNLAADLKSDGTIPKCRFVILGVLWPSKKFAERDLIAGGAAGAGNDVAADEVLKEQLDILEHLSGQNLSDIRALVPQLNNSKSARETFNRRVLSLIPLTQAEDNHHVEPSELETQVKGDRLLDVLSRPFVGPGGGQGGAAAVGSPGKGKGSAAGIGDFFSGIKAGAMNLLNLATYYQMKNRAGEIGERGVNPTLRAIRAVVPTLRVHLMGHSFGGRVVTAAAAGAANDQPVRVNSISLLQAAFSHFAFAQNWNDKGGDGFFRRVVTPAGSFLSGSMIVTHSRADQAVGVAYAIASRIHGPNAQALGDAKDPFGGLGGNGAQKTPEASTIPMKKVGDRYDFTTPKVYNVDGNGTIGGHSDIRRVEVTHAVADNLRAAAT